MCRFFRAGKHRSVTVAEHFRVGDDVCLRVDPARQGMIRAVLPPVGNRLRYPTWMRRFMRHVEAAYLQMRPFTSAVYCFLSYIEVAEQLTLPAGVRNHAAMRAVSLMTNNIISWFNDLISYPQEIARGDVHNLVAIVHRKRGISLETAVAYVIRRHNAEMGAFQRACATLPNEIRDQHGTQRYVIGLHAWIRANVEWLIATARYRPIRRPKSRESEQHAIRH
jgi:Terpene synthase family 2, C-terminal metal binding